MLRLVATPEVTDLSYEVTNLPGDSDLTPRGSLDKVGLRVDDVDYGPGGGMHLSVREGKLVRGFTMVPLPPATRHVELRVSGASIGEWVLPLELVPFPGHADESYREIGASGSLHGVTITVRGGVFADAFTALDLTVIADRPKVRVDGLGGLHGLRDASTALLLHDSVGRSLTEHYRQDARDQLPDPTGIAEVAIFDPLGDDVTDATLEVPILCFDDPDARSEVEVPVTAPITAMLGNCPMRVLGSREVEIVRGPNRSRGLALDIDPGDWGSGTRLLKPWQVEVDGSSCGYGFGGGRGMYGPNPEPLKGIEIHLAGDQTPSKVTFVGATVQARGPWRIPFRVPRKRDV